MDDLPAEWNDEQRRVYGRMLRAMLDRPDMFLHPNTKPLPPEEWQTISHNAACSAADFSAGDEFTILDDDGVTILMQSKTTKETQ